MDSGKLGRQVAGLPEPMDRLILNSILAVLIVVPLVAARERDPRRALRKALVWTIAGVFVYELLVIFVYPRFVGLR